MRGKYFTFLDYVDWRGDLSFDQAPFCEVDALIFSQLTYNKFGEAIPPGFNYVSTLAEVYSRFSKLEDFNERQKLGAMISDDVAVLFKKCAESNRFGQVKVCGYKKVYDKELPVQFSAETYILGNKKKEVVVAFEGTDDTFAGWYEDFNMTYVYPYPSQLETSKYLAEVKNFVKGKIIITGHSKGGSNAVYGAMYADSKFKKRIKAIYNFDGPGFSKEELESKAYRSVKNRIHSYYPHFSLVGMINHRDSQFKIVQSVEKLAMQHDPTSWVIRANCIEEVEKFSDESQFLSKSTNDWIASTPDDVKKIFIDSTFSVLYSTGVSSNLELEKNMVSCSAKILISIAKLNPETRKLVTSTVHNLVKYGKINFPMLNIFQFKKPQS